ncbi:hypothetical protein LTSESEN_4175, partial [Salmonella enterica subsp. enterica serovar Senftenberg str. A4-543]
MARRSGGVIFASASKIPRLKAFCQLSSVNARARLNRH